ncbi:MAG: discoidin domain-containing protein [Planctomycetota bacterium]|jgi:hypothetical protein
MCKKLIYFVLFVLAIMTTFAHADTLSKLTDVTVVDDAIISFRYAGTEYVVADGDLVLGTTTRWYIPASGVETLWVDGTPVPPATVSGTSSVKAGDIGPKADNFLFRLNGGNNISSIDGIDFQETVFPFLTNTFFHFERGGNDTGTWQAILADGSLAAPVSFSGGTHYGDTGVAVGSQNAYGAVFTTDVPVQGVRITASGHDTLSISAPTPVPVLASLPSPPDKATDVPRDVVLGWKPGIFAPPVNGHKVYLSENFSDVNDGIGGVVQDANSYAPTQLLDFGKTYYWRVDEVNAPPDSTIFEGEVWQFTTEPFAYPIENITATASSSNANAGPENIINGSGLDDSGLLHGKQSESMWLSDASGPQPSWIEFQFDKVYKLHEMWVWNSNESWELALGLGFKDVTIEYSTNGTDYATLGTTHEFAQAPGTSDYAHNTTVDFSGTAAQYVRLTANSSWGGILPQYGLSEVRFLYIPVLAREPSPDSGATDVDVDVVLSWRAGREAAQHDVYLGTDEQAVIDGTAPVTTVADTSYGPLSLDLDATYYWKVNEVNMAETPTTLEGDLWNFTTPAYLVVDDFESYNDRDPDDPESNRIFNVWIDGYGIATNGSLVGYDQPPFCEKSIIHGGKQSMPFFYNNTGGAAYSEATLTLSPTRDWTKNSIKSLSLWFHGDPSNAAGQLYVKLNDAKVVYDGDAANITRGLWKQWNIDLASVGTNLQNVTKLSIGIDGNGASGILYIDDIGLYPSAPEPPLEIWIEAEAAASITLPMNIYNDPLASGGQYIGTEEGIGDENNNPPTAGIATYNFTAQGGTYKILLLVSISGGSNSFWVRIPGATNYSPGTHSSGWIKFNGISDGAEWHWDEVHSDDHGQQVVKITLPTGQHTLEIARREDGALLDAILITN